MTGGLECWVDSLRPGLSEGQVGDVEVAEVPVFGVLSLPHMKGELRQMSGGRFMFFLH